MKSINKQKFVRKLLLNQRVCGVWYVKKNELGSIPGNGNSTYRRTCKDPSRFWCQAIGRAVDIITYRPSSAWGTLTSRIAWTESWVRAGELLLPHLARLSMFQELERLASYWSPHFPLSTTVRLFLSASVHQELCLHTIYWACWGQAMPCSKWLHVA